MECGAERQMAGMFPLTEWKMSDGHIVQVCEGRGEDITSSAIQNYFAH